MRLEASDISLTLGGRAVLEGVAFKAGPGELVGLIGPNGSGKSSLLKVMAGITRDHGGSVRLDGREIGGIGRKALSRTLGYLPQSRELNWNLAVEDVVALGRHPHSGAGGGADRVAAQQAMAALNIAHLAGRGAGQLSGGERARVLTARVIAQDTPVLIADEPSSGLDPAQELFLFDLFKRLSREGRTVAVAAHNLSLAARFCDSLVLLHEGRSLLQGRPRDVLNGGNLAKAYGLLTHYTEPFGIPQVVAVRRAGAKRPASREPAA